MRVATALRDVHYVLHAPQGDTYADLLFTMIERRDARPPVTYTTFQARDLGGDTAELFKRAAREAYERFSPRALMVGASCTAELIQDDPGGLAEALQLPIPVVPLELPSYQRKENWGAAETFLQMVRALAPAAGGASVRVSGAAAQSIGATNRDSESSAESAPGAFQAQRRPRCNVLGPTALGFRHRDDLHEVLGLLQAIGIEVSVVAPWGATPDDLSRLPQADFNVVMYPETAGLAASWLQRNHRQPFTRQVPIGVQATDAFVAEVAGLAGLDAQAAIERCRTAAPMRSGWYSASVDATYLTGKRVFIFGDATHAMAAARVAVEEMGFTVVGLGTYSREFARELRELASRLGLEALITDDYLEVEAAVAQLQPDLVLGTQMERHIAKRLGVPCSVISAPVHVQDFPARHSPQMGYEGANVLFDTWVHPLMMGLEEHLLGMFREDFEFHEGAAASHLGHAKAASTAGAEGTLSRAATVQPAGSYMDQPVAPTVAANGQPAPPSTGQPIQVGSPSAQAGPAVQAVPAQQPVPNGHSSADASTPIGAPVWESEAEKELGKIPFFVRGKARRNTERFAQERGIARISRDTLYEAKAHYGR
jgi:light-independent protochlorophyllide reductase subunit B